MKYLSAEGLAYFFSKLKTVFAPVQHSHKMYDTTGKNTDGPMTQKATTEAMNKLATCDSRGVVRIGEGLNVDEEGTASVDAAAIIGMLGNMDERIPAILTADNYTAIMKLWFQMNGGAALSDFSDLCQRWYTITRTGWTGGTQFYHASTSMVSTGTKVGDNTGMIAEASTNTRKGRDDYAGMPLFHVVDCNWILDENGKPHITAIDGVAGNFERHNPDKLVGVLQMTGWLRFVDSPEDGTYTYMYTDQIAADGYSPLPEAIDLDGACRTWVVHAKYATGDDFCCYSGARPLAYTASHNTMLTSFHNKHGRQYGGQTSADDAFLKLMFFLKYASLTADGILQGCVAYDYQYAVAEQETGVERVIVTAAQANNLKVGSTVMVGNPTAFSSGTTLNIDRSQAGMRAKADRKKITRKETLSSGNVAIYIDNGGLAFDTTANTIASEGDSPTYVSTSPWFTGTCDGVLGVDGSPSTPDNGTEPVLLQGIEYAIGGFEVLSDCILKYRLDDDGKYYLGVYVCRDASKYAAEINDSYEQVDVEIECPETTGWRYISEHCFDPKHPEVWFPGLVGCTSSQRTKDGLYILDKSTSSYEWLSFGRLNHGAGNGGLSIVSAYHALSTASWYILARLSATGNRGELAA